MVMKCLNPCCSGGWSRRRLRISSWLHSLIVLILVVLEDGLGGLQFLAGKKITAKVLILVVLEDGLGASICSEIA